MRCTFTLLIVLVLLIVLDACGGTLVAESSGTGGAGGLETKEAATP